MIYTLALRCFSICSSWADFHKELAFLKDIFKPTKPQKVFKLQNPNIFQKIKEISRRFSVLKIVYRTAMFFFLYKFQCGSYSTSYYLESDKNLKVRSGEHIGISSLTFKNGKPLAESAIPDHFLFLNHDPSLDDFTILSHSRD